MSRTEVPTTRAAGSGRTAEITAHGSVAGRAVHRASAAPVTADPDAPARRPRLVAVDVARGLALVGMFAIHLFPVYDAVTFESTLPWELFAGRAAALFALLAGLSLAFSSGGRTPHRGQELAATRAGLVVRALVITTAGLLVNESMPSPAPAVGILVYYGAFFLLAVPLLTLRRRTLAVCTAVFAVLGPVLVHAVGPALPQPEASNPTVGSALADPAATVAQLLLTGTYPALPYLTYLCAGLLLGRLDLHEVTVGVRTALVGAVLAVGAWAAYWGLVLQGGGYEQLRRQTPWLSQDQIDEILVWGPSPDLPTSTWWWLLTAGPHSNTPVTLLMNLGTALAVLGALLVVVRTGRLWAVPAAMGAMTLTLYSAHLLALATEVHYDRPALWFGAHVVVAAAVAVLWRRLLGRGPLERLVAVAVRSTRRAVLAVARRELGLTSGSRGTSRRR